MIHYSVSLYSVKINSATGRQLFLDKPYAILDLMEREVHNAGDLLIIISRHKGRTKPEIYHPEYPISFYLLPLAREF